MKASQRILITIGVGVVLILGFYLISNAITKFTGFSVNLEENDFEKCLKNKDVTLYLNTENLANSLKDVSLKDQLKNIKIINCAISNDACIGNNVVDFPTWIINDNKINGDISFEKLEELSECKLNIE